MAALLRERAGVEAELVHVSTIGDRDQREPLSAFGGVGVFTREVQRAVLDGRADLAVHSLKDLPTEPAEGLRLAAVPEREARFDALVLPAGVGFGGDPVVTLASLPEGGRVGTSSPRRRAQLLRLRPDAEPVDVRGNVDTRLRKLDGGDYDALLLAEAGLRRLGLSERISAVLAPPAFFPAVGQGALGIECRHADAATAALLAALDDPAARAEVTAERAALFALRAGCHAPVGTYAVIRDGRLRAEVVILGADGRERLTATAEGPVADAEAIGREAASDLVAAGAERFL